ncbi:EF-hand domain-containing protein [Saccharopolyspora phatthalungensis]|uniref:Ca2+-binding EF-hand superfamily protein n=1 Tax=Saccharopolyspora phatthalungensis TaxID=664693 RepID=A0A840PS52_9PSEU|nr:EF-hand domain-containing protein [Saccharopolyspora phatthalungensis]MBB5153122.1 Ca2+-binding EF-hand superfamily protein [Saccharopolyspora phatthalungensis]
MTTLDDHKIRKFGKGFTLLDRDDDGVLRFADLLAVIRAEAEHTGRDYDAPELLPLRTTVQRWWQTVDPSGRAQVDRGQFVAALLELSTDREAVRYVFEDGVRCLLSFMDSDGDGRISQADFARVTREDGLTDEERNAAFARMDRDGDGYADVEDLVADYIEFYCTTDPDAPCNGIAGFI